MVNKSIGKRLNCRYNDVFLSIRVLGSGKKNIVAFHGYGQDGGVFSKISEDNPDITLYSFDLFYHGDSSSPICDIPLSHEDLKFLFEEFIRKTHIESFILLGFSMGGKYALSILSAFSSKVAKLILIAPDGIKKDFWYVLATHYKVFSKLFYFISLHPKIFFRSALFLDKLKIVDGRVRKFAINQMNTPEKRKRVYGSWLYLKKLFVEQRRIVDILNTNKVDVKIILGKYDRIIPAKYIQQFGDKIDNCEIVYLKTGHTNVLNRFLECSRELIGLT